MEKNFKIIHKTASYEIEALIENIKKTKSLATTLPFDSQYGSLVEKGVLKLQNSSLTINYEFPTSLVISQAIQEDFENTIPVRSIFETIPLAQKIIKALNKQGITSGTTEFRVNLIKDLILHAHSEGLDIQSQILSVDKTSPRHFEIINSLALAIPLLELQLSSRYQMYAHIYSLTYDDGGSQTLFISLQSFAAKYGHEPLEMAIQSNNKLPGFVSNILVGLWSSDKKSAWAELEKLSKIGYELETLNALASVKIDGGKDVAQIAMHLKTNYTETETTIPYLIWAYANIINYDSGQHEYVNILRTFGEIKNERVHSSLISVANHLKVVDDVKLNVISSIDFGNANLMQRLFHLASKFSIASDFFLVVRNVVREQGLSFDAHEIKHYLVTSKNAHQSEFSNELVTMLTDKIGRIRLGGSRILHAIETEHNQFKFQMDVLSLSEHHQSRMIKSIALSVLRPEDVMKFIVPFRHTKYRTVLQTLVDTLAGIFEDYHYDAIIILRKELDEKANVDKELLAIFEKYYKDLAEIITRKNNTEEFSPRNQARAFEHFLRTSKNKMREKINRDQENDPLFGLVHRVSIARGKSWKIERNNGEPSPLQHVATELTYPRMSLMNPDHYNWDLIVNANTDYKNG